MQRYGHSKLSKMAACRQLGFDVTGNSAIRSADPDNPILEPNMKCIRSPALCDILYKRLRNILTYLLTYPLRDTAIRVSWGHMEPPFSGEGEVVGVSDGTIRKSDGGFL